MIMISLKFSSFHYSLVSISLYSEFYPILYVNFIMKMMAGLTAEIPEKKFLSEKQSVSFTLIQAGASKSYACTLVVQSFTSFFLYLPARCFSNCFATSLLFYETYLCTVNYTRISSSSTTQKLYRRRKTGRHAKASERVRETERGWRK